MESVFVFVRDRQVFVLDIDIVFVSIYCTQLTFLKQFSRIFTTKYHIIRVSFDYDDWRRILIAQDAEYLRGMKKLFSYNVKYTLKEIVLH